VPRVISDSSPQWRWLLVVERKRTIIVVPRTPIRPPGIIRVWFKVNIKRGDWPLFSLRLSSDHPGKLSVRSLLPGCDVSDSARSYPRYLQEPRH